MCDASKPKLLYDDCTSNKIEGGHKNIKRYTKSIITTENYKNPSFEKSLAHHSKAIWARAGYLPAASHGLSYQSQNSLSHDSPSADAPAGRRRPCLDIYVLTACWALGEDFRIGRACC